MNFILFYMFALCCVFKFLFSKLFLKFMSTLMNFKWSLNVFLKNIFCWFYKKLYSTEGKMKFDKIEGHCSNRRVILSEKITMHSLCNLHFWSMSDYLPASAVHHAAAPMLLYRTGVKAFIVMLWEHQSRRTWIGTKFSKSSTPLRGITDKWNPNPGLHFMCHIPEKKEYFLKFLVESWLRNTIGISGQLQCEHNHLI